ncbi:LysR substrate-binding domain-containing protein [Amnibacterium endophyticum]|uniref:LysR substrate-binding domain-containing protein n=1 Tax=Amnibacterium endophyticum TaxID=2109337 RepID=A0ABW4LC54_9MICO
MPLVIGVVAGVTPDRWIRAWRERRSDVPLDVVAVDDPVAALADGVTMVFARLPLEAEDLHVIPLWEETPVVVAARDHPVKAFDAVAEADLAGEEVRPGWDEQTLDLVAAGHGIALMPQSVFRATGRRDLVARPVHDAAPTRIGLAWRRDAGGEDVDDFIGIVRGRTENSSRGRAEPAQPGPAVRPAAPRPRRPTGRRRRG